MYTGVPIVVPLCVRPPLVDATFGLASGADQPCDAEIGQERVAVIVKDDVGGLDVAVDDPLPVGVVQRGADLQQQTGNIVPRQPAISGQRVLERAAPRDSASRCTAGG